MPSWPVLAASIRCKISGGVLAPFVGVGIWRSRPVVASGSSAGWRTWLVGRTTRRPRLSSSSASRGRALVSGAAVAAPAERPRLRPSRIPLRAPGVRLISWRAVCVSVLVLVRMLVRLLLRMLMIGSQHQLLRASAVFPEIGEQSFVCQVQCVRVLPVVVRDLLKTGHDLVVMDLDGEFAPVIEAAGSEVDRAHDGARTVREQHLAVEFEVFELVNLDTDVVHDAQAANALDELFLLQRVRRAGHEVDLHAAFPRADQALDDDLVLV